MLLKTKRTCMFLFFALCTFFSVLGTHEHNFFISQAVAAEVESPDDISVFYEKRQMADAITKVYKYVALNEAIRIVDYAYQYSEAYRIQPSLLIGIIAAESAFKRRAVSKEGAAGYTQVLGRYHKDKLKGRNIFNTDVNIEVGAIVLSECMAKHSKLVQALGCYNGTTNARKIKKFQLAINKRKDELVQLALL